MLKKSLTLLIILVLCLSASGCAGGSSVMKPYLFNENLQTNNIASVIAAENTKPQIIKKAEKEIADMVVSAATKVVAGTDNVSADNSLYDEFLNKAGEE